MGRGGEGYGVLRSVPSGQLLPPHEGVEGVVVGEAYAGDEAQEESPEEHGQRREEALDTRGHLRGRYPARRWDGALKRWDAAGERWDSAGEALGCSRVDSSAVSAEPEQQRSLYRRHRPRTFADVVGQESVVRTLRNAVERGRVHHAYLFVGSRGTGKTSMAKILAACLNCERGPTIEPCGECESCRRIMAAAAPDLTGRRAAP